MTHKYYEQLDSNKAKTPKRNILVVQGDWNAKVGLEAYQHWEGTVGKFGIGETNARTFQAQQPTKQTQDLSQVG